MTFAATLGIKLVDVVKIIPALILGDQQPTLKVYWNEKGKSKVTSCDKLETTDLGYVQCYSCITIDKT